MRVVLNLARPPDLYVVNENPPLVWSPDILGCSSSMSLAQCTHHAQIQRRRALTETMAPRPSRMWSPDRLGCSSFISLSLRPSVLTVRVSATLR